MHQFHRFVLASWITTATALIGCGGSVAGDPGSPDAGNGIAVTMSGAAGQTAADFGSVSAQVQLPSGATVSTASYKLTGPSGFLRSDTLDFVGSQAIGFFVGSVPASVHDYTLAITMGTSNGPGECTASASFGVLAMLTTHVSLTAKCSGPVLPPPPPPASPPVVASSSDSSAPALPPSEPLADASSSSDPPPQVVELGSVGVTVWIPAGVALSDLDFVLTQPGGVQFTGVLTVANTSPVKFIINNVHAGTGETIAFSGTSPDGTGSCSGMTVFDVDPQQKTETSLTLQCTATSQRDQ